MTQGIMRAAIAEKKLTEM